MNAPGSTIRAGIKIAVAIAATLVASGCDDTGPAKDFYLGAIEAGAPPDAPAPDVEPPTPLETLSQEPCAAPVLQGKDEAGLVRSLAALQARLVVASSDGVEAWQVGAQGCPDARIETFGVGGRVAMSALGAAPLPAGRVLVARGDATVVLDSAGQVASTCAGQGTDLKSRWVAARTDGTAVSAVVRSPVGLVSTDLATGACSAQNLALSPESFALLAVVPASDGGLLVAEQETAHAPIAIARYDASGVRTTVASWGPNDPRRLCSAAGLVETAQGVVVVDSACKRVVAYDASTLQPVAEAVFSDVPRAVAWTAEGSSVLVAVTRTVAGGAEASFVKIALL